MWLRLVFIYGPPGVGKLTVATALATLTGYRLFHNHLTVNLVTALFPPNTAAWDRLAARLRLAVFDEAVREDVDLILTRAPRDAGPAEVARVSAMLAPIRDAGGEVVFVRLTCAHATLLERVGSADRRAHNKLIDPAVLLARYELETTLPFAPQLALDVTSMRPPEAAARIAAYCALTRPTNSGRFVE